MRAGSTGLERGVTGFRRLAASGIQWIVRQSAIPDWLGEILTDPDASLETSRPFVADSPLITLARVHPKDPDAPVLSLRRLNYGRARHRWRDVFRRTRAERAFRRGLELEQAGVSTPRAWAAGVERCCRWPLRGYLITEWVQGAVTLEEFLKQGQRLHRSDIHELACLLARMHNAGFSHRDLKASNVLFDCDRKPFLIDLDGVRRIDPGDQPRAVADLARFAWEFAKYPALLNRGGVRFLKTYCGARNLAATRSVVRRLAREILRPTLQRQSAGVQYWKR